MCLKIIIQQDIPATDYKISRSDILETLACILCGYLFLPEPWQLLRRR